MQAGFLRLLLTIDLHSLRLPLEALRRALDGAVESNTLSNILLALKASSRLVKRVESLWRRSR